MGFFLTSDQVLELKLIYLRFDVMLYDHRCRHWQFIALQHPFLAFSDQIQQSSRDKLVCGFLMISIGVNEMSSQAISKREVSKQQNKVCLGSLTSAPL